MRNTVVTVIQLVLTLAILTGGVTAFRHLRATAPEVQRSQPEPKRPQVEYLVATRGDHPVTVRAHGVLSPAQEVELRPEVPGTVTWMSPLVVPGARIPAGEVLLKLDDRNFRYALSRAEAALEQAEQNLDLEEGKHRIARKEWDLFQGDTIPGATLQVKRDDASRRLALRLPQLVNARSAVASARSAFDEARLNLERTQIKAPFNALVQAKQTELGQQVTTQSPLVHLVGTDAAWIELPLTPRQLSQIQVPGVDGAGTTGAAGFASARIAGREVRRRAWVRHLLPRVDQGVRLARVLIEVPDPFGHADGDGLPLLLGEFCEVALDGGTLRDVVALPRAALRDRNQVYLLAAGDHLAIRTVDLVWEETDRVYLREGLEAGERVLVSHLSAPIPGLLLEAVEQPAAVEATS